LTAPAGRISDRNSSDCRQAGDEFARRCRCRKLFGCIRNGEQHRRTAWPRSWADEEKKKKGELEDPLAGGRSSAKMPARFSVERGIELLDQQCASLKMSR
jgi:hypothetical protein